MRALLVVLALLLGSAQGVAATTFLRVDDPRDDVDLNPGDGQCVAASGNFCTLRAAIQEANALITTKGVTDIVINFSAPNTYTFTRSGIDDNAANGDLDILGTCPGADLNVPCLTITGFGKGATVIDAAGIDRVFHFVGKNTVKITGVTIRGGYVKDNGNGGGIRNSSGWVTLDNCEVINNTVESTTSSRYSGGGIYSARNTRMEIRNSLIANNRLINLSQLVVSPNNSLEFTGGGGIFNSGHITISKTVIKSNQGLPFGAGIANESGFDQNSGRLTITDSILLNNANTNDVSDPLEGPSARGGGLSNHGGVVRIERSIIQGNSAGVGGGIFNTNFASSQGSVTGLLRMLSSVVDGNTGNGIVNRGGSMEILYSTISGNKAESSGVGASGGGIQNYGPAGLVVENSTITGNTALQSGGGISNDRSATLTNVTIVRNKISGSSVVGREIFIRTQSDIGDETLLQNTIIGDVVGDPNNCGSGNDTTAVPNTNGLITSRGHNLDSGVSCGLNGPGDITGQDPKLGPLDDNTTKLPDGTPAGSVNTRLPVSLDNAYGNYPKTLLPQAGSQAIDGALDSCPSSKLDQRQFGRPGGNGCDIGALEADAGKDQITPATTDLEVVKTTDAPQSRIGLNTNFGYTLVVTNHGITDAAGVTLTDQLPAGVSLVLSPAIDNSSPPGGGCSFSSTTNRVVCTFPSLPAGQSLKVYLTVRATDQALVDKTVENRAFVTVSAPTDYLPGNNGSLDACVRGACVVVEVKADTVINTPPGGGGGAFGPLALLGLPAVLLLRRRSA
ncbi:MAG: DUF11 domain-containing protein [Gammaproteobacteria bacterium]|nr:DUF11 domain-containing protein [Gammaproteobacteria bacterium]